MLKFLRMSILIILTASLIFTTGLSKPLPEYSFDDIKDLTWGIKSIEKMYSKGFIKGVGNKKFSPLKPVTQLESLVMILRTMGYEKEGNMINSLPKEYTGVKPSWGIGFISLAYQKGLLTKEDLKNFNPNENAKRYIIAKYLVRSLGYENLSKKSMNKRLDYKDWNSIPENMIGYMYVAVTKNLIKGYDGKLFPNEPVKRNEMAAFIERLDNIIQYDINGLDVQGYVYSINNNIVSIKINNTIKTFKASKNIPVFQNNKYVGLDNLKEGYKVRLILDQNKNIIFIEVFNISEKDVITINLNNVENPPEKVNSLLNSIKNEQTVKLFKENGIYYIIATRGLMRTGGYTVDITNAQIEKRNNKTILNVNIVYKDPAENDIVSQAFTNPYIIKSFIYDGEISEINPNVIFR